MVVGEITVCEVTFPAFGFQNPGRKAGPSLNGLNVFLIGQDMAYLFFANDHDNLGNFKLNYHLQFVLSTTIFNKFQFAAQPCRLVMTPARNALLDMLHSGYLFPLMLSTNRSPLRSTASEYLDLIVLNKASAFARSPFFRQSWASRNRA